MTDELQCDCCGAMAGADQIATVTAYGIEASACNCCRGVAERCETTRPAKICPVFQAITGG